MSKEKILNKVDYKEKYEKLYNRVAKLLVNNYKAEIPMSPHQLLLEWDSIRDK